MIRTSNYANMKDTLLLTCSISGNKGKCVNCQGKYYSLLAPKKEFFENWKDKIGKINEEENNKYYIEKYYDLVLSKLDVEEVYNQLNDNILLCYEDSEEFCHRHIVSSWLELFLDIKVPEVKIIDNKIVEVKRPEYIKEYLEEIIKSKINMKGFNSIRALYLFEQGNKQDLIADNIVIKDKISEIDYHNTRQYACYLRCEADEAEAEYNKNNKVKKRIYQK